MKKYLLFCFFYPFLLCIACTERIDIHTDGSEPVIVIYGLISNELRQQEIHISRSSPYFDKQGIVGVSDAKVIVQSSENKTYEFFENPAAPGYYFSSGPWSAKPEVNYKLSVEVDFNHDGFPEKYEASASIIPPAYLDSVKLVQRHLDYTLNVYGQDAETTDYYLFRFAVNDTLMTTKLSQYTLIDDVAINGQYIPGLIIRFFDDIAAWEKDTDENRQESIYLKTGDKLDVKMSLVTKEYFEFIRQSVTELRRKNPMFGGPPSNIITNISNGGRGIFSGYCTTTISVIVP
jgi:hypothetical protein